MVVAQMAAVQSEFKPWSFQHKRQETFTQQLTTASISSISFPDQLESTNRTSDACASEPDKSDTHAMETHQYNSLVSRKLQLPQVHLPVPPNHARFGSQRLSSFSPLSPSLLLLHLFLSHIQGDPSNNIKIKKSCTTLVLTLILSPFVT